MNIMNRLAVLIAALGLAGCEATRSAAPPTVLKMDDVMRMSLADELTPDREIIVSRVEVPPNTTLERHWHPGEEFHYYLAGRVEIVIDGEQTIIGTPGTVGHVPYERLHTARTGDEGATIIVFRVHREGEPVRYLETERRPGE